MTAYSTLVRLYHLLINADGEIHENEIRMGHYMVNQEGMDEVMFKLELEKLEGLTVKQILTECQEGMTHLTKEVQINYLAWMTAIANSDGLMDDMEWKLIYDMYKKLGLPYQEIMQRQKVLNAKVKEAKKAHSR